MDTFDTARTADDRPARAAARTQESAYGQPGGGNPAFGGDRRRSGRLASLRAFLAPPGPPPEDSGAGDAVDRVLASHQTRALHMQALLRVVIAVVACVEMLVFRPRGNVAATEVLASCYLLWSALVAAAAWSGRVSARRVAWAVPLVDLPAVLGILLLAGSYTDPGWNNPYTADGLILICVLAAFQLRPRVTAVTGTASTASYLLASWIGHASAGPDLHYTLGHTLAIGAVSIAAVLLSRIQQSRTLTIADLAQHRSWLLAHTLSSTERDRRYLAEVLHDGALQSVLAARQDIDEAAADHPHEALSRADEALRDVARQLRSSVTELHPAVLERAGLEQALCDLAGKLAQRGRFEVALDFGTSSAGHETDRLLFHCGRELLTNVVKHAHAHTVRLGFDVRGGLARLTVADDGIGLSLDLLHERVAQGHVGLASQRIRVEEAGGALTVRQNVPRGTVVTIVVPARPPA